MDCLREAPLGQAVPSTLPSPALTALGEHLHRQLRKGEQRGALSASPIEHASCGKQLRRAAFGKKFVRQFVNSWDWSHLITKSKLFFFNVKW